MCIHMCVYNRITLLYTLNEHNTVHQQNSNNNNNSNKVIRVSGL